MDQTVLISLYFHFYSVLLFIEALVLAIVPVVLFKLKALIVVFMKINVY